MVTISYLFSSILLLSTGCASLRYITTSPENVAVPSGNSTHFDCASNSSSGVDWEVTTIGQPQATVVRNCVLNPSYNGIYDITQASTGSCNIVVLSATIYLAGAYICQESTGFDPLQIAQLVVLASDPVCTVQFNDGNTTDVAEYELIQLVCTAFYTRNLSPLDTVWTDPNEQEVNATTETTSNGNYKSYIEFTAPSELLEAYSAVTYFTSPPIYPLEATNTPSYTFSWTFPVIDVLYCPNNMTVLDNGEPLDESAVSVGDNLTCYSNGHPDPLYVWIDLVTGQQTEGQSFIVPNTGNFKFLCTASNSFRGDECNISTEVSGDAAAMKVYPQNIAAVVGTNVSMGCSYGSEPLDWVFTGIGFPGVVIVRDCKVISSVTGFYDVDTSTGGCNLIFLDVDVLNAGVYTCQESESSVKPPTAQLIVLNSDPVCSDNVSPDGIVESGDKIRISCYMNYASYTGYVGSLVPTISFFNSIDDQKIMNATNASTVGQALFYIDMTVYPEIFPSFTSRTFFPVPIIPDYPTSIPARNSPLFPYTWNSTQRIVYYCPNEISISPSSSDIYLGETLTCSSNGYPSPSFLWINLATGESFDGPNFILSSSGLFSYECTASNSIRNNECDISTNINIDVFTYVPVENVASEAEKDATMECRQEHQNLAWTFTPFRSTTSVTVAIDCNVLPLYSSKYSTDMSNNSCNLIVLNVDASQAGSYTCEDPLSTDLPPSAILVVLDSAPNCLTTPTSGCEARISCNVTYTGQLTPMMSWTDHNGQPLTNYTYVPSDNEVYSYIDVSIDGDSSVFQQFTCDTYFDAPPKAPPGGETDPASNAPDYTNVSPSRSMICVNEALQFYCDLCQNGATCIDAEAVCSCAPGFTGSFCETPSGSGTFLVQQNNIDASNAFLFNVSWNEYVNGFGSTALNSSYWIGLERLHQLTNASSNCVAHFDILLTGGNTWHWANYSQFRVDSSATDYTLHISGYSGNIIDAIGYHSGRPFATYDHNDLNKCYVLYGAGFWWDDCCDACINNSHRAFYWNFNYLQIVRFWMTC